MNLDQTVFTQLMEHLPSYEFQKCVARAKAIARYWSRQEKPLSTTAVILILQILSVTIFERTPILRALQASDSEDDLDDLANRLILFDL
jgi:hypothetical protein